MAKLLYGLILFALFLLSLAFLSFWLVDFEGMAFLQPVVDNATTYLPVLLLPVVGLMAITLLMRWVGKDKDEAVGAGDFLAALIAFALQAAAILVWAALGNDVTGPFEVNLPEVEVVEENASTIGILGVAILQFLAFFFFWRAKPDPREGGGQDHGHEHAD